MTDYQVTKIPKYDFEIVLPDGTVYRDSIVFASAQEMRNTSQAELDVLIDARYQQYLIDRSTPGVAEETPVEEG